MSSSDCRRGCESLEPRTLLAAAAFDVVDLGVSTAPAGQGVLDVNGFVLTPDGVWQYKTGKAYFSPIAAPGAAAPRRLYPGGRRVQVLGALQPGPTPQAAVFREHPEVGFATALVGTLDPTGPSVANAMGAGSSVVGNSQVPGGGTHGFYATYRHSRYHIFDLNDFRPAGVGFTFKDGVDVNQLGQILVTGRDGGGTARYGVIRPTSAGTDGIELTGPAGAAEAVEAVDTNDLGQVAGSGLDAQGRRHAVLWTLTRAGARAIDLGGLGGGDSRATRVNNAGYAVGDASTPSDRSHAFLYDPAVGRVQDLNALVDPGGMTLRSAASIDNNGQIVGEATDADGNRHAVLLVPRDPMPALAPGVTRSATGVRVNGTTGDDRIVIRTNPRRGELLDVIFNDEVSQFDASTVGSVAVYAGPGDDRVDIGPKGLSLSVAVYGHSGNDRVVAVEPSLADVSVVGGAGDDWVEGANVVDGGSGNDTLIGTNGSEQLYGGFGDDSLNGGGGTGGDVLRGEAGNDTIASAAGPDRVDAGAGNDSVTDAGGADAIAGGTGDDTVDAGGGEDEVYGGAGNDVLRGGEGNDFMYGQAGDDTVWGQSGDDTIGGDAAVDRPTLALPTPGPGDDALDGGAGNDYLVGSRASLAFVDDNGVDTMTGGAGGDVINARGDDVVTDAGPDDVVPTARDAGPGPYAVQQTATLTLALPPTPGAAAVATPLPDRAGKFAGSTFYADADGTLHMQDAVAREFTLGEFFRNWGVQVDAATRRQDHFGGLTHARVSVNGVTEVNLDHWVVHAGDVINVIAVL